METKFIQITSGRGPAECQLAVALTLKELIKEATACGISHEVISRFAGHLNGTLSSAAIKLEGKDMKTFIDSWIGVLLWVIKSPYRSMHKRKNWYLGVFEIHQPDIKPFNESEITFHTMRSSGPGGQHVNKTETAVRAIHKRSGLFASYDGYRSQLQNKQMAIRLLKNKYVLWQQSLIIEQGFKNPWEINNNLDRGNPIRIYKGDKFLRL